MLLKETRNLAVASFLGLAIAPLAAGAAFAQETRPREAVINVSGEGESTLVPDMAVISLSVVKQAETAEAALAENNKALADVLEALKADGIAERDIQTSNFSIQPQYQHSEPKDGVYTPPVIVGYQVSNGLTVRVRDLAKLGQVLDQSVRLGINQGGNIVFTNDKPEEAIAEARKAAMAEAIAKARLLTEAAGVQLGRVIEINENFARPMGQPMFRAAVAKEMSDAVPIATGENTYSVTVNVTFAIEQ